jgi:hypothetical protein
MSATAALLRNLRKEAGSAIWLFELLLSFTPATWGRDCDLLIPGIVSDKQLAIWLGVKLRTIETWRRRLRAAGLIDWTLRPGVGRMYALAALKDTGFLESRTPAPVGETKLAESSEQQTPNRKPLASRFVQ